MTSFRLTRNWWEGEKPATDLISFTRSASLVSPLHYLHCYHFRSLEHVWLKMIQLKSSHHPQWELKGLSEAISTKFLGRNDVTKTRPEYCSKWPQRCRILGFFGDQFHEENLRRRCGIVVWGAGFEILLPAIRWICVWWSQIQLPHAL